MPPYNVCFSQTQGCVTWEGKHVVDAAEFNTYLRGPVRSRLIDQESSQRFESDLRALATTGMAATTLEQILMAAAADPEPWQVGEALAECLLEEERGAKWPWNMERDKRTPKASLPGADLVGFIGTSLGTQLLVGEVKTSDDLNRPPAVMYGRSGMVNQLDTLANNCRIHFCLVKWLYHRCRNTDFWVLYEEAVRNYLSSGGRAFVMFGLLMRDTSPHDLDLKHRAVGLAGVVVAPTRMELNAWYLPTPISRWPLIALGAN